MRAPEVLGASHADRMFTMRQPPPLQMHAVSLVHRDRKQVVRTKLLVAPELRMRAPCIAAEHTSRMTTEEAKAHVAVTVSLVVMELRLRTPLACV